MKNDIETLFESAKAHVILSTAEKDLHRAQLLRLMQETGRTRRPIPSPLSPLLFAGMRYAFAALLVIGVSGTGIAFAAEKSLPDSPLYLVKVRVAEPIQVALTFDEKERAELEVELVNRRLKEFAEVSVQSGLSSDALIFVSDSLAENIDAAQAHIMTLQENQDTDTAFETAADLSSTLSAHAKILKRVLEANPSASADIQAISAVVESESTETATLVDTAGEAIQGSSPGSFDEPADSQQDNTLEALDDVKADIEEASSTFDTEDRETLDDSLGEIDGIIGQAKEKDGAGDPKSAYFLYSKAGQKITELRTTVEGDQELGIDIIGTATTTSE